MAILLNSQFKFYPCSTAGTISQMYFLSVVISKKKLMFNTLF